MQLDPTQRALYEQLCAVMDAVSGSHGIPRSARCDDEGDATYTIAGPLSLSFVEDEGAQWHKEATYTPALLTKYLTELRAIEKIDENALMEFHGVLETFMRVFDSISTGAETTVMIIRAVTHRLPIATAYQIGIRPTGHQGSWKASFCVVLPESLSRSLA